MRTCTAQQKPTGFLSDYMCSAWTTQRSHWYQHFGSNCKTPVLSLRSSLQMVWQRSLCIVLSVLLCWLNQYLRMFIGSCTSNPEYFHSSFYHIKLACQCNSAKLFSAPQWKLVRKPNACFLFACKHVVYTVWQCCKYVACKLPRQYKESPCKLTPKHRSTYNTAQYRSELIPSASQIWETSQQQLKCSYRHIRS